MTAASIIHRRTSTTLRLNYYKHPCWNALTSRSNSGLTSAASPAANQQHQEKDGRSIWLKALLFATGAFTFLKGTDEITRFLIQSLLLAHQTRQLEMEPLQGNQISTFKGNLPSLEYRRLQCKGTYDEKKSIYVGPRYLKPFGAMESGYYLITPLIPLPGDPQSLQEPILVNRGWVPKSWRDKDSLDASELPGNQVVMSNTSTASLQENSKSYRWTFWHKKPVVDNTPVIELTGVVRHSEKQHSVFTETNDPGSNKWSIIDIKTISGACGLSEETICVEDMSGNNDLTRPFPCTENADEYFEAQLDYKRLSQRSTAWYLMSYAVFRKLRRPSSRIWDFQGARF